MQHLHVVIVNNGDGSNSLRYVLDQEVLEEMEELADQGDDRYASGDGLQVWRFDLGSPEGLKLFMQTNCIELTTMDDVVDTEWHVEL